MLKRKINPTDAAWFYIDKTNPHAHFGPLMILSPPKGRSRNYVKKFVDQWRSCQTFSAPFNYQLTRGLNPEWEVLEDD